METFVVVIALLVIVCLSKAIATYAFIKLVKSIKQS